MMAGFLLGMTDTKVSYSCCVPYDIEPLKKRFPQIKWLPYTQEARLAAVSNCDIWLGLGGSPFQSVVSDWFTKHLKEEAILCKKANKPMYFLGIGGQDEAAYQNPDLKTVIKQAKAIWTRDSLTFHALKSHLDSNQAIHDSSDLSHVLFRSLTFPNPTLGSLAVCLNFDYKPWKNLKPTITTLSIDPTFKEHVWLVQESRPLPEAEYSLHSQLSQEEQKLWKTIHLSPKHDLLNSLSLTWPTTEWVLSSRFHTVIASSWAGSKTVVLDTNLKLRGIAEALNLNSLGLDSSQIELDTALHTAKPASIDLLHFHAKRAQLAIDDFIQLIGV